MAAPMVKVPCRYFCGLTRLAATTCNINKIAPSSRRHYVSSSDDTLKNTPASKLSQFLFGKKVDDDPQQILDSPPTGDLLGPTHNLPGATDHHLHKTREAPDYLPPDDLHHQLESICRSVIGKDMVMTDHFNNLTQKIKILQHCHVKFQHRVQNSQIDQFKSPQDVLNYYTEPLIRQEPITKLRNKKDIPKNLNISDQYPTEEELKIERENRVLDFPLLRVGVEFGTK